MRCLKRLFSETVSYGLKRKKPKLKEAKSHISSSQFLLNRNDSCSRVVVEANEDYSPDAKRGNILNRQGVTFVCFSSGGTIKVSVRYKNGLHLSDDNILNEFQNKHRNNQTFERIIEFDDAVMNLRVGSQYFDEYINCWWIIELSTATPIFLKAKVIYGKTKNHGDEVTFSKESELAKIAQLVKERLLNMQRIFTFIKYYLLKLHKD